MAAVSAWSKPGAWALESEEHDASTAAAAAAAAATLDKSYPSADSHQSSDFPSLSAAATAKIPKKKKKQTLSLAEFTTGAPVTPGAGGKFQPSSKTLALTSNELLSLPTGPRERSEEELQRPRGFGYGGGRDRGGSDERGPRSEPRDLGPSRADEVDDWGATKKSAGGFERRERDKGFFDSQSRADDSESWISKKGSAPPPPVGDGRRERRSYDLFNKEGSNGSGMDSDSWGKKREESVGSGRPRLTLQPRTLPVAIAANVISGDEKKMDEEKKPVEPKSKGVNPFGLARPREEVLKDPTNVINVDEKKVEEEKKPVEPKSKGVNPFGLARPREEVLKEKGKDWKEIDEKLDAVRIQDTVPPVGRKGFGTGNGFKEDRTERAWRKPSTDAEANGTTSSPRAESVEEQLPEN